MQNNTFRLPRPMGMTQALLEYSKNHDTTLLENIRSYFIQQWIINNQFVCGRSWNILELSSFLHCEPDRIRIQMRDQLLSTKLWDRDKQEELINALIGQQVGWALEDRMAIEGQVRILQQSQGGRYAPFITSEVNKALGLKLQSTANLSGILKSLQGGGSINIFNSQQNTQVNEHVSMEQAIHIIGEENAKLVNPNDMTYIEAHYNPAEFPEVVATKQIGINTDKEGLNISSAQLDQITDNYKELTKDFEEDHHQMRREIELAIDTSEDDPEMQIYPQ